MVLRSGSDVMIRKEYPILFLIITVFLLVTNNVGRCRINVGDSIQPPENYYIWHFDELTFGGFFI